ncbi:Pyruvate carboxyltransferase [Aspergillus mulundensis]|uniref:2-isopropylmalate synthase n=1 Tax=Aspergillus mulundensis TaxID=1810919 RepID=A0A3D8QHC1_9EURO|nr:Pyruvate carboxyltransferase [Aspergillus mulundensis]RDW61205.1 Pyruvate carboxyltransferase [Aspergillus mulundensis]
MPMLRNPSEKYEPFIPPDLPDRTWPSRRLTKAPRWLATDLRDGNQALACPMNIEQKWSYFQLLLATGFKEIDISFPSASETEFAFTRRVVASAPDDVWLQVLSPCRREHIRRTVDSVTGAKKAIISLYIASSDTFIETMFASSREEVLRTAVDCVRYTRAITKDDPAQQGTSWNLMFSPEAFSDTESEYAIALCKAVKDAWGPAEIPMILNLPATVERCTPNTYADQVEIFARAFAQSTDVVVSLHPHNDRGSAVAAAELGQLAGATRVEGCLFGNGERTGNVDLVTLALNLYSQGVDPGLDFSDLPRIRAAVEQITHIPVHMRAPYAGDSVFMAYSGSHQDAINKGFKKWRGPGDGTGRALWKVPYLPIDPADIGATYEAVIRVNSQSGKGGVAWVLQRTLDLELPKEFQVVFSKVVKAESEGVGRWLTEAEITQSFFRHYAVLEKDVRIVACEVSPKEDGGRVTVEAIVLVRGRPREVRASGEDAADAVSFAFSSLAGLNLEFETVQRRIQPDGQAALVMALVKCRGRWRARAAERGDLAVALACLSSALDLQEDLPADRQFMRLLPIVQVMS